MRKRPLLTVLVCLVIAGAFVGAGWALAWLWENYGAQWLPYELGGLVTELALALLTVLLLLIVRKGWVLRERGLGVGAGFAAGGFLLAVTVLMILAQASQWMGGTISDFDALHYLAYMLAIGLAEELTFRGLIQTLLADAFGRTSRKGVWLTVLVSGFLFGLVHMTNLLSGVSFVGCLMQAVAAMAVGMYLGAVYVRCGNIWALVLLHGVNDMAALMGESSIVDAVSAYGPERLITVALYVVLTAFILRGSKLDKLLTVPEAPAGNSWYN